ncbi:MAG: EAL domain-containing protein [Sphingosinicella sp.]|nr:EAL domain-containing protein [Sphingosinicella sp.]
MSDEVRPQGIQALDDYRASESYDVVVIGSGLAALLVIAGIGNYYFEAIAREFADLGFSAAGVIISLIATNVAVAFFGWRRYRIAEREVRERSAAEKRAQSLASTDPLTGFLNRRSMNEGVESLLMSAARRRHAVAMLVVDIDGFKTVNDLHGHHTGDNLLRMTAEVIRRALPYDAATARLGGDEFAAAFAFEPNNHALVDRVVAAIVDRLGKPFDLAGVHTHVSASVGVARSDAQCVSVDSLMRRADIAMHAAKKLGRGRWAWFDASMQRELQTRNELETGLRKGIPAGEVVPYFEQQIDLVSGNLCGFEMLARWVRADTGLVMPDEFIPIAEECGLIGDLSMSVMRQALAEARGWDSSLMLSVNISPVQLKDPWLAQKIAKLLSETGYPAERLEVEITESSLFENLGLAQAIVSSLKNQGIRLALDDFGTGYSSLAHLRALPFDRIKIDRSFISSINENPESAAIVTAITRLADSLNLAVTAEGIEDDLIEARLRSIGTYHGQGWLFGKPMQVEDVRALLAGKGLLPARRSYRPEPARPRRTDEKGRRANS